MNSLGMSLPCVITSPVKSYCSVHTHMDELMSKQEEVTELEISHALMLSYSLDYIPGLLR